MRGLTLRAVSCRPLLIKYEWCSVCSHLHESKRLCSVSAFNNTRLSYARSQWYNFFSLSFLFRWMSTSLFLLVLGQTTHGIHITSQKLGKGGERGQEENKMRFFLSSQNGQPGRGTSGKKMTIFTRGKRVKTIFTVFQESSRPCVYPCKRASQLPRSTQLTEKGLSSRNHHSTIPLVTKKIYVWTLTFSIYKKNERKVICM